MQLRMPLVNALPAGPWLQQGTGGKSRQQVMTTLQITPLTPGPDCASKSGQKVMTQVRLVMTRMTGQGC
jgi:hypothetical protein